MPEKLSLDDFRAIRRVLKPSDFAISDGKPDPPPSDLVSKKAWFGIMDLPDDVAIRTSNRHGKILGEAYWLWGRWVEAVGFLRPKDALFGPMLDACDDLQSSAFNALHGYYRVAFSAFRNVLELMTVGVCDAVFKDQQYKTWRKNTPEFKFKEACDKLSSGEALKQFNDQMRKAGYQSLWDAKSPSLPGGYCRKLYSEMCNYTHSRRGFTDADLWKSNGPIYDAKAFWEWYLTYLRVISLSCVMVALARPHGNRALLADLFINDKNVLPPELLKAGRLTAITRRKHR